MENHCTDESNLNGSWNVEATQRRAIKQWNRHERISFLCLVVYLFLLHIKLCSMVMNVQSSMREILGLLEGILVEADMRESFPFIAFSTRKPELFISTTNKTNRFIRLSRVEKIFTHQKQKSIRCYHFTFLFRNG